MSDQDKTKEKYVVDFIKAFDENERAMEPFKDHRRDLRKNYTNQSHLMFKQKCQILLMIVK